MAWQKVRHVAVVVSLVTGLICAVAEWGFWGPALTAFAILVPILSVALLAGMRAWQRSVSLSVVGSLGIVACAGLVVAFGWSGVAVLVVLVATSPALHTLLVLGRTASRASRPSGWDPPTDATEDDEVQVAPTEPRGLTRTGLSWMEELPTDDSVTTLDDEALCRAWRRSYLQLDASGIGSRRLAVVRLRELYLDELSRRHPAEVRQWLASGARAAGNPLPFLRRPVGQTDVGDAADDGWPDPE